VRTYTDGSVLIYQSRVFTEQGGNIEMFSANGDLNAGKGPKSSAAYPPLRLICDVDGYCRVNPAGLVTGAGIGALLSIPGQDPALSNVILTAPHGAIDAGAAGIRVAGDLHLAALQVLNAFNIQVQGTTVGLSTVTGPNIGALTSASNMAGATQAALPAPTSANNNNQASVIIVEVIGFGGSGDENQQPRPQDDGRRSEDKRSYNMNSVLQLVGNGPLSDAQKQVLTDEEKRNLDNQ
jgi:Filamentous haemagglutinin family outer membrane protein